MYAVMELGHGTVMRRFEHFSEAREALDRLLRVNNLDPEEQYGIVEFGSDGRAIGEPIIPAAAGNLF
jgi:hypothetical protein